MAKMIAVKAKVPGIQVPREDNSRRYIGDEPVLVERSTYYIRRLAHDELEELGEAETKALVAKLDADAKATAAAEAKAVADAAKSDATTKGKE